MTDAEFSKVASIAAKAAGLSIPASKKSLVQSRIARRMRDLRLASCQDYLSFVDQNDTETRELISVLTTNVSAFYRENHHFEFLVDTIIPKLRAKLKSGGRVRLWSAGCSSGQEPFTLAMELTKAIPNIRDCDLLILGTDIDPKILKTAIKGTYSEAEVEAIAPQDRERFLVKSVERDGHFVVNDDLKKLVRFRELNLHGEWPMQVEFDAIFCRNVVIYFDDDTQRALWPRFRDRLVSDGWLMLGHSERIHPLEETGFTSAGVTIYQKN